MENRIEKGKTGDIDELGRLYDELNDYLEEHVNYPGWAKGIYPVRETAETGVARGTLYVLRHDGKLAGSVILNHEPEAAYEEGKWLTESDYEQIMVIHTLVVHPKFRGIGVGRQLMDFAREHAKAQGMVSIRLDVSEHNVPAIALYERCGYRYVGIVDLRLNIPGLQWFRLYELIL